jgi:hypothetical protein
LRRKTNTLDFLNKVENRSAFVAAKTIEDFFGRADGKRRGFLFMKWATRHPVRALLLELHVVLDDANDVRLTL